MSKMARNHIQRYCGGGGGGGGDGRLDLTVVLAILLVVLAIQYVFYTLSTPRLLLLQPLHTLCPLKEAIVETDKGNLRIEYGNKYRQCAFSPLPAISLFRKVKCVLLCFF
jgi:hypothetical protein